MKSFLLFCFLLFAVPAFAAVGVDTDEHAFADGFNSLTISGYVVTGSNTLALCGVATNGGQPQLSMTFNGVGMDEILTVDPYSNYEYSAWQKAGVSGTHDFVLTMSDNGYYGLGCSTFTGVDQTTPIGSYQTATTPANITLTVPTNGLAWDFAGDHPTCAGNATEGAGQTPLFSECVDLTVDVSIMSSYRTTTGDFTWSGYWVQIGVPINPVAATTSRRRAIVVQ